MNKLSKEYGLYPIINENVRLTVIGQNITISFTDKNERINILSNILHILEAADGQRNIEEICYSLQQKFNILPQRLLSFFLDAEKKGIISFLKKKSYMPPTYIDDIFPIKISLILTDKCNLRCIYCYGDYKRENNQYFPFDKVENLFINLKQNGTVSLDLTGGEPSLHPNFLDICELSITFFDEVAILTNGVSWTEPMLKFIETNKNKVSVQISIDGCTEGTNRLMRKTPNTWIKTLNTIKRLSEMNAKLKIAYMLTYENKDEYLSTCDLMAKLGVSDISISMPESIGRGADLRFPDQTPISNRLTNYEKEFTDIALKADAKYGNILYGGVKKVLKNNSFFESVANCGTGWKTAVVDVDGDVIACQTIGKASKLGNIYKNDIFDIFKDNQIVQYLCNFKKSNKSVECQGCSYQNYCGRCFMKILYANLDMIRKGKNICPLGKQNNLENYIKTVNIDSLNFNIL